MLSEILNLRKKGFTLIELLVVIAIIALLLAILAPSLQKARVQAKSVICMSNMKQITNAAVLYAMENSDYFPISYSPEDLRAYCWKAARDFPAWPSPWQFYLWGYHKSFLIYSCPVYPMSIAAEPSGSVYAVWTTADFNLGPYKYTIGDRDQVYLHGNYAYNNFIGGQSQSQDQYKPKKTASVPSRVGLFGDSWLENLPYDMVQDRYYGALHVMINSAWTCPIDARHNGKVNVGFVDGSVRRVEKEAAYWEDPWRWSSTIWWFNR